MEQGLRVLVVEDEPAYRDPLVFRLEQDGYRVQAAANGIDALKIAKNFEPQMVLLDLMLPGLSGTEVCRQLRETSDCGIIMVSAKDEEVDKILGLELGADDYITKPYSYRELLARLRAVARRREQTPFEEEAQLERVIEVGQVKIDLDAHQVLVRGEKVDLPLREFTLLHYLMENSGRVLTRSQLLDEVWGYDFEGDGKTLHVHIKRLRSRIEEDPSNPKLIQTIRGVGYRFG